MATEHGARHDSDLVSFHPELRAVARVLPRGTIPNRTVLRVLRWLSGFRRSRVAGVEALTTPDGVAVRLFRPRLTSSATPGLLWMHGGGFVMGDASLDDRTCRLFADRLGITVASVDYRLAPEHPHPAALHDCYSGLRWLAARPDVDAERLAVGGASAGAGLAAALALHVRDDDSLRLVHQLLVYPMLDDRPGESKESERFVRMWNRASSRFAWSCYLGDADPEVVVPARRADLTGLPQAWVGVGTLDLLYDEDVDYAHRLRAAGVACELVEVVGAFHGFDAIRPRSAVARRFVESQIASLRAALHA